jgi:hypothetical protein
MRQRQSGINGQDRRVHHGTGRCLPGFPKGVLHGLEAIEESLVVEIKSPAPDIGTFFAMPKQDQRWLATCDNHRSQEKIPPRLVMTTYFSIY